MSTSALIMLVTSFIVLGGGLIQCTRLARKRAKAMGELPSSEEEREQEEQK